MGILVGEGLKKAAEGGSSENFGMLMKSFQQLQAGKTDKLDYKVVGEALSSFIEKGVVAAATTSQPAEGAPAAGKAAESMAVMQRGLENFKKKAHEMFRETYGENPLTQSQKLEVRKIAERAGRVRRLYEKIHVYESGEEKYREQSYEAVQLSQKGFGDSGAQTRLGSPSEGGAADSSVVTADSSQIEKNLKACIAEKQRLQIDIYNEFARVKVDEKTAAPDFPLATSVIPGQREEKVRELKIWLEDPGTVAAYWAIIPEMERIMCVADKESGLPAKPDIKSLSREIWGEEHNPEATTALLGVHRKQNDALGEMMLRSAEANNNIEMKALFKNGRTAVGSPESRIMYDVVKGSGLSQMFVMMAQFTASTTTISRREVQEEIDNMASYFCSGNPMESTQIEIKGLLKRADQVGVYPSWQKTGIPALMLVKSRGTAYVTACDRQGYSVHGEYSKSPKCEDVTKFLMDLTTLVKTVEDEENLLDEYMKISKKQKREKSVMAAGTCGSGISEKCMEELKETPFKGVVVPKQHFAKVKDVLKADADANGNKFNVTQIGAEVTAGHILLKNGQSISMENIKEAKKNLCWKRKRDDDSNDETCFVCKKNKRGRSSDGSYLFAKCDECFKQSKGAKGAKGSKGKKGSKGWKGWKGEAKGRGSRGRGGRGDHSGRGYGRGGGRASGSRKEVQVVSLVDRDGKTFKKSLDKKTMKALQEMRDSGARQIGDAEEKALNESAKKTDISQFLN